MIITNEADYALRIMRALADGEQHTVSSICEQESVPQQFAYKIIRKLSDGGVIQVTRGVKGGVKLMADLHDVTLFDIVEMTDAERYIIDCMRPGNRCVWMETNCKFCQIHGRLMEIQNVLDEELKKESLYNLITDQPDKVKSASKNPKAKTK